MFSTFTGNSRRPRNVNLSGQASNPFSNTSWTPSAVSNATKTVSDAQADREKRQAERRRLKAASQIQRTWRGYRSRSTLRDQHRHDFDLIYQSLPDSDASQRIYASFPLLLSFFSSNRAGDMQRLSLFVNDCNSISLQQFSDASRHPSRLQKLMVKLVQALGVSVSTDNTPLELQYLLLLINHLATNFPFTILGSVDEYYTALAKFCQTRHSQEWVEIVVKSLSAPLDASAGNNSNAYRALALRFLTIQDIHLFEENIDRMAQSIDTEKLAREILDSYNYKSDTLPEKDRLFWLLAHYIDLSRAQKSSTQNLVHLKVIFTQLSALSSDISIRINPDAPATGPLVFPSSSYVSRQLLWLVDNHGISNLLHDFSTSLAQSTTQELEGSELLAGYILALLQSFPSRADDTRMRLFLEEIPAAEGQVPIVKYLWQMMTKTSVFQKLRTESERPAKILHRYFYGNSAQPSSHTEEQEWRIILLFLELYTFILRISDDEDFLSGIYPKVISSDVPKSRTRSCSLALKDVEALITFLKNTAFALHYSVQEITQTQAALEASTKSRLDSYWGDSSRNAEEPRGSSKSSASDVSTKLDLESLRAIITTTLKMLYERDSRKHFLSADHWLMTSKLEKEDFIGAVIAEEERQIQEQADDSDMEADDSQEPSLERIKANQMRAQRERRLAEMGPKLEVLKHIPFVVPFETRVMIFRQFVNLDRIRRGGNHVMLMAPVGRHHAKIRRGQLFEDAFEQFYQLGEGLKDPIQITFVDQFDTPEAGIDGGGVTKEFLTSVTSEAFGNGAGGLGMFTSSGKELLYPNPTAMDVLRESLRKRYEFLGRIVGKCMYEGILVDLAFAGFFLLKWPSPSRKEENSYKGSVNDLQDMDEELYRGLLHLKNYSGDVSALGLDFTITDQISAPGDPVEIVTRKLVPGGDEMVVTNDNRLLYISYAARHRLVVQPAPQTTAFLRGLREIIRPSWLSMFNQSELQRLVGGDSLAIDVDNLRQNTVYSGLYTIGDDGEEHPTIKMFWNVMNGFTDAQRRDVLKYVTSTPRAPLLGFAQLNPKFAIRDGSSDQERLPSASTCVNLLKLPIYKSESTLRKKLLYAITAGAGFDLS
ncbi:HECT-domain (ubiquitin-transferase) domain-containing protein [Trichoderma breve]|uniref:HECT-type E3 ubiquitin transferase n=1 Tax=Trichoderma breve TaxID=2034170 RepID=A0A9W9BEH4_9HYPO|nr:HECT-domain (ubiquitin-transferase) domain-containing protein [Trichoderma breve]KAJ4861670.1 HECT-domain (ubiquitin-transferase) domain-containing protein [Trichoderma breve]